MINIFWVVSGTIFDLISGTYEEFKSKKFLVPILIRIVGKNYKQKTGTPVSTNSILFVCCNKSINDRRDFTFCKKKLYYHFLDMN